MLDLEARFSPKIIPASVEYPYGKLKPNTTPANNDGTPVAADTGNDIEGFKQAAITRANITPSGLPDTAVNSQLLDSLDKRYLKITYQPWTFMDGGVLTDCSQAVKHSNGEYYSWTGVFPEGGKIVAAGTDPTVDTLYVSRVTPFEHLHVVGAPSTDNTGTTYVQDLIFDNYGHVTGLVSTEIREGNTSQTGIVQLTDSISSTSTTTAATPNSVKSAYNLAAAAIPSAQKGVAGGVATLDGSGKVPTTQLPSASEIGAVPVTRKVNSKPLSEDVTITASDVNAAPSSHVGSAGDAHGVATTSGAGFMSAADKIKLDSMGSGGDYTHPISGVTAGTYKSVTVDANGHMTAGSNPTTLAGYGITDAVSTASRGVANGIATLDASGLIPSTQLPSYVDDVLEYANLASFPATGEAGKIYVALDTNKTYRWSSTVYVYITSGAVDSVAGKTGVVTLVKGDVGLGNVDNTSDLNKPVSTAQQTALSLKANLASPALTGTPTAPTAAAGTNTTQLATTAFVTAAVNSKVDTAHTHAIADVSGLQAALNDKQVADEDLTAIATLAGTSGFLKKTAANTWSLDTNAYITENQSITVTGDASGSGTTSIALTLANSGATAGTYKSVTVDAKGRVTSGTNPTTLAGYGITNAAPSSHVGSTGTAHGVASTSVAGFMSATDKTKLDGIATGANAYVHPTGDGNLHVPANGTTSNGYVLKAGSTAGSISWGQLTATDVNAYSKTEMPYETGTFTPVVSGGMTAGVCAYSIQVGRYTRIGNRVLYMINVVWSGHTGVGTLRVSLPFVSSSATANNTIASLLSSGLTFTGAPQGITVAATNVILVRENRPGAAMADIPVATSGSLIISGQYEI